MIRQPVTSSQLKSVGYDPETETLEIEFAHGGSVYQYSNVPPGAHADLMAADSAGAHFTKHIKQRADRYPYKKVAPVAKPSNP